jgi:hypothetical protein
MSKLGLENSLAPNNIDARRFRNRSPSLITLVGIKFIIHSSAPSRFRKSSLMRSGDRKKSMSPIRIIPSV